MTLSLLFTLNAVVAALFGVGFLLVPGPLLGLYGLTADPATIYLGRLLGGAILGYAAVAWLVRNAGDNLARQGIVLGYFIGFTASLLAALIGQFTGAVNALGWSTVVLYGLFALGYGYFQFMKPAGA